MLDINGTIMSGDSPIARIEANRVIPLCKERMPIYLARGGNLEDWLTSRAIDRHRPNSRILKKILRLTDTSDLATVLRVHAATITDNYWLRQENEPDLTWAQVRFAESTFAELALMGGVDSINRHYTPEELAAPTPELTNIGSFEKCWKLEDGTWYMYKQGKVMERFSELFTSRLCVALGLHAAEYTEAKGSVKTRDFTESRYNFEPAADLVGENEDYIYNYDTLEGLKPGLGQEYLDMGMKQITINELRAMTNTEGLILQGCGGDPQEWLDGINELLTKEGILRNGDTFKAVSSFENEGHTNLLFHMDGVDLDGGKLTMWRLQTHSDFGGTWLSDYVPNRLGGFTQEQPEQKKPDCPLVGQDGNVFNLVGTVSRTLRRNGLAEQSKEMCKKIASCGSYNEALCIMGDYVNITLVDEPEQGGMEMH